MTGRSKPLPKGTKKQQQQNKKHKQVLETPDDFQEAADAEEATGGKWRAGDQAKSSRAFMRAIEIYDQGLAKHPRNFDLAYNKARLELELSEQSNLVSKLPISFIELLQQALASHRYAIRLDETNTDIAFNTAQVLISLAEAVADGPLKTLPSGDNDAAVHLLEALDMLGAVYSKQEEEIERQQASLAVESDNDADGGVPVESDTAELQSASPSSTNQAVALQSATIEHPTTFSDLLDTARASLTALTQLVSLDHVSDLTKMGRIAVNLIAKTIPYCLARIPDDERDHVSDEIALQATNFVAASTNAEYRVGMLPLSEYISRLEAFQTLNLETNFAAICDYADSLVTLGTEVTRTYRISGVRNASPSFAPVADLVVPETAADIANITWQALTKAQTLYGAGFRLENNLDLTVSAKAVINENRGDAEMLRFRLLFAPFSLSEQRHQASKLVQNATVYYRAAMQQYRNSGDDETADRLEVRRLIARLGVGHVEGTIGDAIAEIVGELKYTGSIGETEVREMLGQGMIAGEIWDNYIAGYI